jgi:hypothetical protein
MFAAERAGAFLRVGALAAPEIELDVRTASVVPVTFGDTYPVAPEFDW